MRAARAVAESSPGTPILVVDNDSGDRIAERLAREVPQAEVVIEAANRGYGAACNRGARETSGDYLLLLNSDAVVRPGAIAALATALDREPRAAVAGPRLLHPDGTLQPSIQRLPTPWRVFCESAGLAALAGGRGSLRGHTKTREDHSRSREVAALMGAAVLVRRSAFEEVGGFDEGFFLYAEEADLFARLAVLGHRVLFVPEAEVVHAGGASGGDALFGRLHEGLHRYVRKHHGAGAARFAAVSLSLGAAARYGLALVTPGERGRRRRRRYRAALTARSSPPER